MPVNTSGSNPYLNVDTSKLSGYAKTFVEAKQRGASDEEAHRLAQELHGKGVPGLPGYEPPKSRSSSSKSGSSSGSSSFGSKTSPTSSGSSKSTSYVSPEEVEAALGMGGMLMPEMQVAYGGAAPGGEYYVPTESGWTKSTTPPSSWTAPYAQAREDYEKSQLIEALNARLAELERQLANPPWSNWQPPEIRLPELPQLPEITSPEITSPEITSPETVTQPPTLEGITTPPAAAKAPAEAMPKGASGFMLTGGIPLTGTLPSADELYEIYRKIAGEDSAIRDYLATPQFQGILTSGNIPLWMATNPTWQAFLRQLGVLTDAIRGRLGSTASRESA